MAPTWAVPGLFSFFKTSEVTVLLSWLPLTLTATLLLLALGIEVNYDF